MGAPVETWPSCIEGAGREGGVADPASLLRPGLELELIRLPADVGRPFAVAVHRRGTLIGYLPRPDARIVARLVDRGGRARAFVLSLRQERSLAGKRLKEIAVEIEAGNADGSPLPEPELAEIAARVAAMPAAPPPRRGFLLCSPVAGGVCAGLLAVGAWANMPATTGELDPGSVAAVLAVAQPESGSQPAATVATAAAPPVIDIPAAFEPLDLPPELQPHASLTLPAQALGFDQEPLIGIGSLRASQPAASSAPVQAAATTPARLAQASLAQASIAQAPLARPSVPLPPPRPDIPPRRKR